MVARGEIGLLICQAGFKGGQDPTYSLSTFWALVLNIIVGSVLVALILRRYETLIRTDEWGNVHPVVILMKKCR